MSAYSDYLASAENTCEWCRAQAERFDPCPEDLVAAYHRVDQGEGKQYSLEDCTALTESELLDQLTEELAQEKAAHEWDNAERHSAFKDNPDLCRKTLMRCDHCPSKTPFRPDPERLQLAKELRFEPPLDEGIREIVITLIANGVEAFESCEGGEGHSFPWPTVRFEGAASEGLRALSVALENGITVDQLRRTWSVIDGSIHGPWWEMTFIPPRNSPLWAARNTAERYAKQKNVTAIVTAVEDPNAAKGQTG